jgi:hypothetical protein
VSDEPPEADVPGLPDVPAFVEILNRHGVRYVIIGGSAAQFSVPGLVTYDVDFSPATDPDNLRRLSAALQELGARIRTVGVPEGLMFSHDGESLGRVNIWNLQCSYGAFDITFEPSGGGYEHLAERAHVDTVRGVDFPVADLADVVASKSLANRPKDQLVLPALRQALKERDAEAQRRAQPPPTDHLNR